MTPLWNRRAADEFAAALEGHELSDAAEQRTRQLVAVAHSLSQTPEPQMRPEFASSLRTRLMDEATHELGRTDLAGSSKVSAESGPVSAETRRHRRRRRVVSVATGVAVLSVTSIGAGFASQSALPGEALYPVKRSLEQIHVAATRDAAERGSVLLGQARTRLDEVSGLWDEHHDDPAASILMEDTLDTFSDEVADATVAFVAAYRDDSDSGGISKLREFNQESLQTLDDLNVKLPAEVTQEVVSAAGDLADSDSQAVAVCQDCSTLPPLDSTPSEVLSQAGADTGDDDPTTATAPIVALSAILPGDLLPFPVAPDQAPQGGEPGVTTPPDDPAPASQGPTGSIPPTQPGTTDAPTTEPPVAPPDPTTDPPTTDPSTEPTTAEPSPTDPGSSGSVPSAPDPSSTDSASESPETSSEPSTSSEPTASSQQQASSSTAPSESSATVTDSSTTP